MNLYRETNLIKAEIKHKEGLIEIFPNETLLLYGISDSKPETKSYRRKKPTIVSWQEEHQGDTPRKIRIAEAEKDTFGDTALLFGIPAAYTTGRDLMFTSYYNPSGDISTQVYGMREWEGFHEISQAIFFQFGGLSSWMFRDLLPQNGQMFSGCSECTETCICWFTNMRNVRRELEASIIHDRMMP
ncbi:hypothetical protein VE04_08032 [Pseudogymnoascus sp. 24MN13]|nr:hypothetical protein VE04_08032 [Pseudogymnoascus sp. 24MN13]